MSLEKINDEILLTDKYPELHDYAVCLKMIFLDLSALHIKEVDNVFKYYSVGIDQNGRISISLPKSKTDLSS